MKSAIISIKPEYITKILSREKTIEIRKKHVRMPLGTDLWLYATRPYARIVGVSRVKAIERAHPNTIWKRYSDKTGITHETFMSYVNGAENITAITLEQIQVIEPFITLEEIRKAIMVFHPPQYFSYIESDSSLMQFLTSVTSRA